MSAVLVLLSAFLHALWNALLKRYRDPQPALVCVVAVAVVVTVIAAAATPGGLAQPLPAWAWSVAAGLAEAGYIYTLAVGLERAPLSVVYTIARGGAVVLVWPAALLFFDEPFSTSALLAAAMVVIGIALVGRVGRPSNVSAQGLVSALACAVFIAGYHLAYKLALESGGKAAAATAVGLGVALPINLALLGSAGRARAREMWRRHAPALAGIGVVCAASFFVFLVALRVTGPGEAFTLRNSSVVFAQLFALGLGERPTRWQWLGVGLVTVGAVLLSLH